MRIEIDQRGRIRRRRFQHRDLVLVDRCPVVEKTGLLVGVLPDEFQDQAVAFPPMFVNGKQQAVAAV